MPRRLLRDRQVVDDEWSYLAEAASDDAAPLIVTLEQWRNEPDVWLARGSRLGLVLQPAHKVEDISADLRHFSLLAAAFTGASEGRGYTQGRLLRERYDFTGELRATGYVRHDQLFFLARCGFNSFEMADADLAGALSAFATFSFAYQPSNDLGLAAKLRHG
jgi:uncharacterized protein (DUF934 family)